MVEKQTYTGMNTRQNMGKGTQRKAARKVLYIGILLLVVGLVCAIGIIITSAWIINEYPCSSFAEDGLQTGILLTVGCLFIAVLGILVMASSHYVKN